MRSAKHELGIEHLFNNVQKPTKGRYEKTCEWVSYEDKTGYKQNLSNFTTSG
jgi:hypothetical protein